MQYVIAIHFWPELEFVHKCNISTVLNLIKIPSAVLKLKLAEVRIGRHGEVNSEFLQFLVANARRIKD